MEKTMSVEERIKKAEGIYYRRNGLSERNSYTQKERKSKSSIKKMFMQIFICLMIYIVFYTATNREYIFSEDFRKEVNSFFTEKTKINEIYSNIKNHIPNNIFKNNEQGKEQIEKKEENNNQNNQKEDTLKNNDNEENIGGAEEDTKQEQNNTKQKEENKKETTSKNNTEKEKQKEEKNTKLSQMEKDAKNIKSKIKFITPIKGTITSKYGWRNPTTSTVPKNHTGLDIGAAEGTKIKSATEGTVILASSEGDYGKHYQIKVKDVILVYAHCKTLYLKKGDKVKQGQEIAEVGSTGNSTGPHLHFEIRIEDRKVDPQIILDI